MPRQAKQLELSREEREVLEKRVRGRALPHRAAQRAQVVLYAAEGMTRKEVARRLHLSVPCVRLWRNRFAEERLAGLEERPGRGRPAHYTEADRARVISTVCAKAPPGGQTHGTVRSLAQETGVARSVVHRILRAERLQPHRVRSGVTSTDPEFETKALDILGLYLDPPENALVLRVDEKTTIPALDRTQPTLPLRPGQPERRSVEDTRNGTTSLYAALAVHAGEVVGQCASRHRHQEFRDFLRKVARTYPEQELHIILDNFSAHKHQNVRRWLRHHPRVHLHFTPTHASWLNQVELWFSILSRRVIRRGVFPSLKALIQAIMAFIEQYNQQGRPFRWADTPERLQRTRINGTKH